MNKRRNNMPDDAGDDFEAFEEWEEEGEGGEPAELPEEGEAPEGFGEDYAEEGDEFAPEEDISHEEGYVEEGPAGEFEEEPLEEPLPPEEEQFEEEPAEAPAPASPARRSVPRKPAPQKRAAPREEEPARMPAKFDMEALGLAPDVPVQVIAVVGKRGVTIKELMEMRMGQVIDLKRPPNETVDIVVNGKLFARGELVEIDGKMGVKIVKIVR